MKSLYINGMAEIAVLLNCHLFFFRESIGSIFGNLLRTCQLHEPFINEPMLIGLAREILYLSLYKSGGKIKQHVKHLFIKIIR